VTHDVPAHGLVVGNPARLIGFVCACGHRLDKDAAEEDRYTCPSCGRGHHLQSAPRMNS
jgi:UDP-2-acetamido-3-amino-2,3-dideoxy-glucuronate N-acetyltransferase